MASIEGQTVLDEGDPRIDMRAFRRCLGQFTTGVTVITTESGGRQIGLTANSFSSLSLEPSLILWSIGRKSRYFDAFKSATHFAVNILAANQVAISQRFASPEPDRFAGVSWQPGRTGSPLINGVIGTLECTRETIYDGGDHALFVGRVEHFVRYAGSALIFAQGRYAIAGEHPDFRNFADTVKLETGSTDQSFQLISTLLRRAFHARSRGFDDTRRSVGLTMAENRCLSILSDHPNSEKEWLIARTYLANSTAEDAISSLTERSLIVSDLKGCLDMIAEGKAILRNLRERAALYEAKLLADIPAKEIGDTKAFLKKFIQLADQE